MSNYWKEELTKEQLTEIKLLHKNDPSKHIKKLLIVLSIWFTCACIAQYEYLPTQLICWIMIAFCLTNIGELFHLGAHGSITQNFLLDRVIGFFCGLCVFFPCNCYRATHLIHHKYKHTLKDPDNLDANISNKTLRVLVYYLWFAIGGVIYSCILAVTGVFRSTLFIDRVICFLEVALMSLFYYLLFTSISEETLWVLTKGWLIGIPLAIIILNIRGLSEHTQLIHSEPPDPIKSTRTVLSNRFVRFFFNNQNYHLEHHLFPRVPWYNLPKVHQVLKSYYIKKSAPICKSYSNFIYGAFRYGPLNTISYNYGKMKVDQK